MKYIDRYENCDKRTQEQLKFIIDNCQITDEYLTSLDILATNYDLMYQSLDDMAKNGFEKLDHCNRVTKNHALQVFQYTQNIILKILSSFPSNPMTKAKIKRIENTDALDADEYIADLLN